MKKKLSLFIFTLSLGVLTACGAGDKDSAEDELKPLEVELEVQETADVGENIQFKAYVTFGDEKVADADEVEFEVYEEGKKQDTSSMVDKNSDLIPANNEGDGSYTAEKTFDKDGVYVVQVHVTARDLHTMPLQKITVGDGDSSENEDEDASES